MDGAQEYAGVAATVRVLETDRAAADAFGQVQARRQILVAPDCAEAPWVPG